MYFYCGSSGPGVPVQCLPHRRLLLSVQDVEFCRQCPGWSTACLISELYVRSEKASCHNINTAYAWSFHTGDCVDKRFFMYMFCLFIHAYHVSNLLTERLWRSEWLREWRAERQTSLRDQFCNLRKQTSFVRSLILRMCVCVCGCVWGVGMGDGKVIFQSGWSPSSICSITVFNISILSGREKKKQQTWWQW